MSNIVSMVGLYKTYGILKKNKILENLELSIDKNTCVAIVGPNGIGKSTLLKIISGIICYDSGSVRVEDIVGYCPEVSVGFDFMTGKQNLDYFINMGISGTEETDYLSMLNLDSGTKRFGSFSKGMKRKLDIARALSMGANVLIMDEPFDGLDPISSNDFVGIINKLKDIGKTIIISSHDLNKVERVAEKIYFLKNGVLNESSQIQEQILYVDFEGDASKMEDAFKIIGYTILKKDGIRYYFRNSENIKISKIILTLLSSGLEIVGFGNESLENFYVRAANE